MEMSRYWTGGLRLGNPGGVGTPPPPGTSHYRSRPPTLLAVPAPAVMAITKRSISDFCQARTPPKQPWWVSKGRGREPSRLPLRPEGSAEENTMCVEGFLRH